ncbi:MAG TPA: carbohydrate ABC transporter permease [Pseudobacteroides sp.]|nr:carbohydrate ABC transporter permease [Pseudobacteroides sp.]
MEAKLKLSAKLSDRIFGKSKETNTRKQKLSDRIFDIVIIVITTIAALLCLLPVVNVAAVSLSSNSAIISSKVFLWPVEFTIDSYRAIFTDKSMMWSMVFTIIITVIYTVLSMALTIAGAYPLSKKNLKGRNVFLLIIVITMYFSGGIIPDYVLVKSLGLLDSMWSLILPGAISAFNLILLKSFFNSLPEGLEEAARIDGCTDFGVLVRIVLPLSLPIIATLSLFYAVGKWNSFMDALFYITDPNKYPLQLKLYQIVVNSQSLDAAFAEGNMSPGMLPDGLKAASVMFATIPIVCVYPFIQKHFIKGVMIGAIKE